MKWKRPRDEGLAIHRGRLQRSLLKMPLLAQVLEELTSIVERHVTVLPLGSVLRKIKAKFADDGRWQFTLLDQLKKVSEKLTERSV